MIACLIALCCHNATSLGPVGRANKDRGILFVISTDSDSIRYISSNGKISFLTNFKSDSASAPSPPLIRWTGRGGKFVFESLTSDVMISDGIHSNQSHSLSPSDEPYGPIDGRGMNAEGYNVVSDYSGLLVKLPNGVVKRVNLRKWLRGPFLNPQPSPDGKNFSFSIANVAREIGHKEFCTGYVVSLDEKHLNKLGPGNVLRWSHSGKQLIGIDGAEDGGKKLLVYEWPSQRCSTLAKGKGGYCYYGAIFSPSDKKVAVFGKFDDKGGSPVCLYTINLLTGQRQILLSSDHFNGIDYAPTLPGMDW